MIGILVITHGEFAQGLKHASELIMGESEQFETIGLFENSDFDIFKESIYQKTVALDQGEGVLILSI